MLSFSRNSKVIQMNLIIIRLYYTGSDQIDGNVNLSIDLIRLQQRISFPECKAPCIGLKPIR